MKVKDSELARLLRAAAIAGGGLAVVASAAAVVAGLGGDWLSEFMAPIALLGAFFAAFVWLAVPRQPHNLVVWLMAGSSLAAGMTVAGAALVMIVFPGGLREWVAASGIPLVAPSQLPRAAAWALFVTQPLILWVIFIPVTLGLLVFPDGRLPSRRWRIVGMLALASTLASMLTTAWQWRPWSSVPAGPLAAEVSAILFSVWLLAAICSPAALVVRVRHSSDEARQQLKWVLWGGSVFGLVLVAGGILEGSQLAYVIENRAFHVLWAGALAVFLSSYGFGVAKYRLYEIDIVISRTVVYGALAVAITAFYVAVVVGVARLMDGVDQETSPWLAIGATAMVALAFEPLRARLYRFTNRLVYGRRTSPYQVLSEFSRGIGISDAALLEQLADSLTEGTTAARADVLVADRDGLLHSVLSRDEEPLPPAADLDQTPGVDMAVPVVHDGEVLGAIALSSPRGHTLLPSDRRLLEHLAPTLGLALRNIRLDHDLRRQIEHLRRSRRRIVAVQDETRRHLERDLHDGAQQRLVAIRVKLAVVKRRAERIGETRLVDLLVDAATRTERTIESLRDFARGVHPPLLQAEGITAAVSSQVARLPVTVTVDAPAIGRYPPAVEATVYFCAVEAIKILTERAHASSARLTLRDIGAGVIFVASEDGVGSATEARLARTDLAHLVDRLDVLDGTLEILVLPGGGTAIRGEIPTPTSGTNP